GDPRAAGGWAELGRSGDAGDESGGRRAARALQPIALAGQSVLTISAAVEGDLDEVVLRRLVGDVGAQVGSVYANRVKPFVLHKLVAWDRAELYGPWLVLIALDQDATCAAAARTAWLPTPSPGMCFRIAVRAIEAWLLADREGLARLLAISPAL